MTTMTAVAPPISPRASRPPSRAPFTRDTVSETALHSGFHPQRERQRSPAYERSARVRHGTAAEVSR